ncbi:hypothetical protein DPMN_017329 [Dreissena polymorpha]|uniref:Uncharacterized protein n=1 Tax=Dreissena polymorpha TaxID=45954 RepID=A0A9D4NF02_DREPO|nr:hypothetical protein DPMN_017329 [Dreissena polymorpha]
MCTCETLQISTVEKLSTNNGSQCCPDPTYSSPLFYRNCGASCELAGDISEMLFRSNWFG